MKIVYKQPGKAPHAMVIPNSLKILQDLVGGYIETVPSSFKGVLMIVNEEGWLMELEPNFYSWQLTQTIFGPVIFCGKKGEEFCSLTDFQAAQLIGIEYKTEEGLA